MTDANRSGKRFNIVLSILIAVLLWFYVVNVENPIGQTTISAVPVEISGASELSEKGLMVTDLNRDTVNIKAVGKRKTFLKLYNMDMTLFVDVSAIDAPGEYRLLGRVSPESSRAEVTLSERDSFAITVTVKKKVSREIPVIGEFHGTLASGFDVQPMQLNPGTMEVSGPEELMERVSHVVVVLSGEGVKETMWEDASFVVLDKSGTVIQDPNLICSAQTVQVTMPVVRLYEIPLTVSLKDGGGASGADAVVTITPATVKLTGSDEQLSQLKEINLGEVDLAEVFTNKSKAFVIPIPEGASNHNQEAEAMVNVTVNAPMKSISATQIQFVNVPKGFQPSVTDSLQVWVRGPQSQLDQVGNEHIKVVVDLAGAARKKGQQRAQAQVYLTGPEGVGVVGTDYSIALNLK